MQRPGVPGGSDRWFAAWLLVGPGYGFAVLGALSIGIVLLPITLLATAVLVRRRDSLRGVPGVIAGLGTAPLLLAYLNRQGPVDVCTNTATSSRASRSGARGPG